MATCTRSSESVHLSSSVGPVAAYEGASAERAHRDHAEVELGCEGEDSLFGVALVGL